MDQKRPAKDNGTGYGKWLLLCQERVKPEARALHSFLTHALADIFHPPYPPIASQSISRDVPVARARAIQFSIPLLKEVAEAALYCAHQAMHYNIAPSKLARYLFRDGG